jgi:hypothetical protein
VTKRWYYTEQGASLDAPALTVIADKYALNFSGSLTFYDLPKTRRGLNKLVLVVAAGVWKEMWEEEEEN